LDHGQNARVVGGVAIDLVIEIASDYSAAWRATPNEPAMTSSSSATTAMALEHKREASHGERWRHNA
jgi:hypothetical protein